MTRDEVLQSIEAARKGIEAYKREELNRPVFATDSTKIREIEDASTRLIVEAKTIGAAGQVCPKCDGSGRV